MRNQSTETSKRNPQRWNGYKCTRCGGKLIYSPFQLEDIELSCLNCGATFPLRLGDNHKPRGVDDG